VLVARPVVGVFGWLGRVSGRSGFRWRRRWFGIGLSSLLAWGSTGPAGRCARLPGGGPGPTWWILALFGGVRSLTRRVVCLARRGFLLAGRFLSMTRWLARLARGSASLPGRGALSLLRIVRLSWWCLLLPRRVFDLSWR